MIHARSDKEFFKTLSEVEIARAEAIEAEIHAEIREGFTEDLALSFVRAVMLLQEAVPDAKVWGIFATALQMGLGRCIEKFCVGEALPPSINQRKRKRVRGV